MFKKILHGLDGSTGSLKALKTAIDLAKRYEAELHTITIQEMPHTTSAIGEAVNEDFFIESWYGELAKQAKEMAREEGITLQHTLVIGHEIKTIIDLISEQAFDLLVIGAMGRSALYGREMGSTCSSLMRLAPCSVLVVK